VTQRAAIIRGVIDLHAHILPAVDDGPKDLDGSAALAAAAVRAGTTVLAATSHVNRGFGRDAGELAAAREAVVARLEADGIRLEVVQGGEVSMGRLPDLSDDDLRALTLGGGPCVLLECPFSPAAGGMGPMVADLLGRGFQVLLAHPERSPGFQADPSQVARLVARGATAQLTAGSLAGDFGDAARRAAFTLLERELVHVLASDAHHHLQRPPGVESGVAAIRERFGDARPLVRWMTSGAPEAILDGRPLPERPPLPSRERRARGLLRRRRA
jgi:protein-tyrosine phosphatase